MIINEIDLEQRQALINLKQTFEAVRHAIDMSKKFKGGMHWKKSKGSIYLFKTSGHRGYGKSLGVLSPKTEKIYHDFHAGKNKYKIRLDSLNKVLRKQARMARVLGLGRVPRLVANILRRCEQEGLMNPGGVTVLGTHALFAYEAMAGITFEPDLMATRDIDFLFDPHKKMKLSSNASESGLLGVLKHVDSTFELASQGHYRAINSQGFMVELVKNQPSNPFANEQSQVSQATDDLVAVEMAGLKWLAKAPTLTVTVIADDGMPLNMTVPDLRYFALNKLWMHSLPDRDPVKKPRDIAQAKAVAAVAQDYLGLSFDRLITQSFPTDLDLSKLQIDPPEIDISMTDHTDGANPLS